MDLHYHMDNRFCQSEIEGRRMVHRTIVLSIGKYMTHFVCSLIIFIQGIGDSSQGFANAILFVIFSKNVRESFKKCIQCKSSQRSLIINAGDESGESSRMLEPSRDSDYEATTTNSDEEREYNKEKASHNYETL